MEQRMAGTGENKVGEEGWVKPHRRGALDKNFWRLSGISQVEKEKMASQATGKQQVQVCGDLEGPDHVMVSGSMKLEYRAGAWIAWEQKG